MTEISLTADRLRSDIADALFLSPADITDDVNLLDLGLDSVRIMQLVDRWRVAGAQVSFADLAQTPTVSAWVGLLVAPCSR